MTRQVTHDGRGFFEIRFGFDRRLVDLVKSLPQRRWNPGDKYWSVPEDHVVTVVEALQPEGFLFDDDTIKLYTSVGGTLTLEPATAQASLFPSSSSAPGEPGAGADDDYTVVRLNEQVKAILEGAFPAPIWIVGEISGFNKSSHKRHVTFHLVDRDESGKTRAEVSATLFERTKRELVSKLAAAGDPFRLEDEITVRVRARVELYTAWGLYRVVVEDLDIHYTLGEAARRREEIVRRLTEAGLVERNTSLTLAELPLRIGLITSLGSDAYNDVLRTFLESGFAFDVTAHGARVQGSLTEPSVLNALDWFRARADSFDVVMICRGGGSRTDLAWFDSEPLGRAVAGFPLPVVVGIGHEQDHSVLDAVGWRQKTPTAAAAFLVERVSRAMERVEQHGGAILEAARLVMRDERAAAADRARRLATAARNLLSHARTAIAHLGQRTGRGAVAVLQTGRTELRHHALGIPRAALIHTAQQRALLDHAARQVAQGSRRDLAGAEQRIAELARALRPGTRRQLDREKERTDSRIRRLELVDPLRVVERGYSILRTASGRVVIETDAAPSGTMLEAQLKRGRLRVRSEGPSETK